MAKTMEETTVKRGRGRPPLSPEEKKQRAEERKLNPVPATKGFGALQNMEPGDNSKYLTHALAIMDQPPIDTSDPVQVEQRIHWYFEHCVSNDMKPTVNGMCNALGIHRDTLFCWKTGEYRKGTHQEVVLKAYRVLEELWENYMLNGKINPVAGIYLSKNLFPGYSDKQEFVLTPNQNGIPDAMDASTLEAKYAELPDSED